MRKEVEKRATADAVTGGLVDAVGRYLNTLHAEYEKGHAPEDVSADKLAAATEAAAGEPVTA